VHRSLSLTLPLPRTLSLSLPVSLSLSLPLPLTLSLILSLTLPLISDAADTVHLTILHTSDLHGRVLPRDFARDTEASGSLSRVSAAVERLRESVNHPVLVLDSGDTIQGSAFEAILSVEMAGPSPSIEAMNAIGYDAMAVGNHEFNYGLEVLRRAESDAEFPLLGANIVDEISGEPAFRPYVVRTVGGIRVGLLGLVTPNIPSWEEPANYRGLRFEDMAEAAATWVPRLRKDEGCDLVVVLSHAGFGRDLDGGGPYAGGLEDQSWRVAQVDGVDLVLTGHTHRDIAPRLLGEVIVSQPLDRGRRLTRIDLDLTRSDAGWVIAHWSGENLNLEESERDEALEARFAERAAAVESRLAQPLTRTSAAVSVATCRIADCAAVDLIHAVQLEASGAEVSLASLLTDRTPDLPAGPVTRRWVQALYVYPNTLRSVHLTGAQLRDVLEHSARYYDGLRCDDAGCRVLPAPGIPGYNVDSAQGVTYGIDPSRPVGDRIVGLRFRGEPLDPGRQLTVVCNNYRAAGGGSFPHLADAPVVWRSSSEVADLLAQYLSGRAAWTPAADHNWFIVAAPSAP
jgi:2',3'-cyclic-nucleotide 2'-phosphodiesterase/3'-nucleotidase